MRRLVAILRGLAMVGAVLVLGLETGFLVGRWLAQLRIWRILTDR